MTTTNRLNITTRVVTDANVLIELVGKARLLRTESILSRCIHAGLITVAEADAFKATLATKRYAMKFASFADLEAA